MDLVVSYLRIVLNLITHGDVTAHCRICPIPETETLPAVGLTRHPMTDCCPLTRKVLRIGALVVRFELTNRMHHLSNAKVLIYCLLKHNPVRPIKKRFGPWVANLSPLPPRSYQVNSACLEQKVTWVLQRSLQLMKVIGEVLLGHKRFQHATTYHVCLVMHIILLCSLSDS